MKEAQMQGPNPLELMIVDTLQNPQIFTMLMINHLFPNTLMDMQKFMEARQRNGEDADDGVAYDFLQSVHGGIVRSALNPRHQREHFRSLLIAVLKQAIAEGGENG